MELRLNLLFLGVVTAATAALTTSEPYAALDPTAKAARSLGGLEDAFARDPGSEPALLALVDAYFDQSRPELVIAAVHRARGASGDSPETVHRLARAYESLGRFTDARTAADRAFEGCRRVPDSRCSTRRLAIFEIHRGALGRIVAMGIDDPRDERIQRAYDQAMRRIDVVLSGG